jgi:hypothetical protein
MTRTDNRPASLEDIKAIAADILALAYSYGLTEAEAGARIEREMDGTQPSDLITEAVALATLRSA